MAFIDFDDNLLSNGDLWRVTHQRGKIRNILEHHFADVPRVEFDISTIIGMPLSSHAVMSMLMSHLADFGVDNIQHRVDLDMATGVIDIQIESPVNIANMADWDTTGDKK